MTDLSQPALSLSFSFRELVSESLSDSSVLESANLGEEYPPASDEDESTSSASTSDTETDLDPINHTINPDDIPTVPPLYGNPREASEARVQVPFGRELDLSSARTLSYRRRRGEVKTTIHLGQRKLLMSEIEFLTEHGHLANRVVYAGAAHGLHIPILSELFPGHQFHLYDPAQFLIQPNDQIWIYPLQFNDQLAEKYRDHEFLFISDIRTVQNQDDPVAWEQEIQQNMEKQQAWVQLMKPKMSLIKIRFPYSAGQSTYLAGSLRFQVWAGQTSTETRLITDGTSQTTYDHTIYNDALFRFNRFTRTQWYSYPEPLIDLLTQEQIPGLDHCYDCRAEVQILLDYYRKFHSHLLTSEDNYAQLLFTLSTLSAKITDTLGHSASLEQSPHGLYPEIRDREERECQLFNASIAYQRKAVRKRHRLFLQHLASEHPKPKRQRKSKSDKKQKKKPSPKKRKKDIQEDKTKSNLKVSENPFELLANLD